MEHKASFSIWCGTFLHAREKNVFFLNALKISLTPASREGPFHVMFARSLLVPRVKMLQKKTFALAHSRIRSFLKMMTLYMFVIVKTIFLSASPSFSPSVVTMSTSKPTGVFRVNRWKKGSAERIEKYFYESLAFLRQSVDLEFDEGVMKPERLTGAPENAG